MRNTLFSQADDGVDYVIVLQTDPALLLPDPLPQLPPNARYERHENRCYDLGTIGWLLATNRVDP